ncbi:MAG TPA: M23 family metallopeptidase [Candidatus Marinimicrobia bacterium]|nr:M23 family metallopeptidase [Candidatus Neomarinimicrobiota bacterium]
MFGRKKNIQKQYIIISQDDHGVRQHNLSRRRLFTFASMAVIILAAIFFFSADSLTNIFYKSNLAKIKQNYAMLSTTLEELHDDVAAMSVNMKSIEEKDKAIRTYADMPQIDKDIRKLGIGGVRHAEKPSVDDVLTNRIKSLEMDVQTLSRKVKLELSSYSDIYNKVTKDVKMMHAIPSIRPIAGGYLNSTFGYRKDPINRKVRFHYGQDITINSGEVVLAPADGTVKEARYRGGYGNVVKIDHGYGYTTLFGHLSTFNVKKGQKVKRGNIIGKSGNSGRSTAPHLHYEVHHYGTPQNPLDYFFSGYLQ